ncbi:Dam family site-specific DNA-(adenine-N6)-methyltransferase [Deinococcus rufus]|uniref:Site-specific DNA-methyltransferase (adenine-specific) n=1 Tax=Deinococcus rufus TaxID=2136097 RepID=A0ABV7Z7T8_9DEIO
MTKEISFKSLKAGQIESLIDPVAPFRQQIFKWVGNKQSYAHEIVNRFCRYKGTYFEPFVGSGSIISTLAPKKAMASDTNMHLITIFRRLLRNKEEIVKHYSENYYLLQADHDHYFAVRERFNSYGDPFDLLFLSRACYGGIIRFRKSDGHMTTPPGTQSTMKPDTFSAICDEWRIRLSNTHFDVADYKDSLYEVKSGDFVYCDPPYIASQDILYGSHGFKFDDLMVQIEQIRWKGAEIMLSIDSLDKHTEFFSHARDIWKIDIGKERLNRLRSRKASHRMEYLVRFK